MNSRSKVRTAGFFYVPEVLYVVRADGEATMLKSSILTVI